ncbi:MAG: EAL domain-containing protein, partial [Thiobacillaceae bacterium]|nr:EAL domain-containing protein [Thiobacillaceae bacterium]
SSLAYLKRFPLDQLKIDQSFVRDLTHDTGDRELVSTIIAMARKLRLKVLAEGVETREQFDYLVEQGCDAYQGYLYSRPVPADEFESLLRGRG